MRPTVHLTAQATSCPPESTSDQYSLAVFHSALAGDQHSESTFRSFLDGKLPLSSKVSKRAWREMNFSKKYFQIVHDGNPTIRSNVSKRQNLPISGDVLPNGHDMRPMFKKKCFQMLITEDKHHFPNHKHQISIVLGHLKITWLMWLGPLKHIFSVCGVCSSSQNF